MVFRRLAAAVVLCLAAVTPALAQHVEPDIVRMMDSFCDAGGGRGSFAIAAAERAGFTQARAEDSDLLLPIPNVTQQQVRIMRSDGLRFAVFVGNTTSNSGPTQVCAVLVFPSTAAPDIGEAAARWLGIAPTTQGEGASSFFFISGPDGGRSAFATASPEERQAALAAGRLRLVLAYVGPRENLSGLLYMTSRSPE